MPQRRPPTDSEPLDVTPEQLASIKPDEAFLAIDEAAIVKLYGTLPDWLPKHVRILIRRYVAALRQFRQSPDRIAEIVSLERENRLEEVPGTVTHVDAFFDSANFLAHVQWALSLPLGLIPVAGRTAEPRGRLAAIQRWRTGADGCMAANNL